MKVVWLINGLVGKAGALYNNIDSQSGGWIDLTLEQLTPFIRDKNVELHIICPVKKEREKIESFSNCIYHYIKWNKRNIGELPSKSDSIRLFKLLDEISPNVIMLWGTEYSFVYSGSLYGEKNNIPILLYVQGVVNAFCGNFNGHLYFAEMKRYLSPIDSIKLMQTKKYYKRLMKQAKIEIAIYQRIRAVISDNEWCFAYAKSMNPSILCYDSLLPLNNVFKETSWKKENADAERIFTIAGRTAYKGLHNVIKAVALVKREYPNIKLYVPGNMGYGKPAFIKKSAYLAYLENLIKKLQLKDNVIFTGKLSAVQMREQLSKCACFVMPSMVENHSSSLREAMLFGAPSVSALVGSCGEIIKDEVTGLLYRDNDYISLADKIIKILHSNTLQEKLSVQGRRKILEMYERETKKTIYEIYTEIMAEV